MVRRCSVRTGCVQRAYRVLGRAVQGGVAPGEAACSAQCSRAAASTAAPLRLGRVGCTAATAAGPHPRQTGRRRYRSRHRARSRLRAPCASLPPSHTAWVEEGGGVGDLGKHLEGMRGGTAGAPGGRSSNLEPRGGATVRERDGASSRHRGWPGCAAAGPTSLVNGHAAVRRVRHTASQRLDQSKGAGGQAGALVPHRQCIVVACLPRCVAAGWPARRTARRPCQRQARRAALCRHIMRHAACRTAAARRVLSEQWRGGDVVGVGGGCCLCCGGDGDAGDAGGGVGRRRPSAATAARPSTPSAGYHPCAATASEPRLGKATTTSTPTGSVLRPHTHRAAARQQAQQSHTPVSMAQPLCELEGPCARAAAILTMAPPAASLHRDQGMRRENGAVGRVAAW